MGIKRRSYNDKNRYSIHQTERYKKSLDGDQHNFVRKSSEDKLTDVQGLDSGRGESIARSLTLPEATTQ